MANINVDKPTMALLMADFATAGIGQNPIGEKRNTLAHTGEVLDTARGTGIFICYCISHFRAAFPEDRTATSLVPRGGPLAKCY